MGIDKYINKIIQGDCLEVMKEFPDKSVNLILIDPPYFLDWKKPITFSNRKDMFHHKKETEVWDSTNDIRKYYSILFKIFDRLLKETGSLIIFSKTEYITYLDEEGKKNNFDYKMTICWHKTNPAPQVRKKNYVSSIEFISWLARWHKTRCLFNFNFSTQNKMHNFIETPICMGKERTSHPTQKPLKLIKKFIEIHSNENDLILDCFAGSGTTLVACKQLNRRYIGIEKEPKYVEVCKQRLAQGVIWQ